MNKKNMIITISCVIALLCITLFATVVFANSKSTNPLDTGKEIIYYLFWTSDSKLEDDINKLQEDLSLTDTQMEQLKQIGLDEHFGIQNLTQTYSSNTRASISAFNNAVTENSNVRNNTIQSVLGEKTEIFRNWIAKWWEEEREYRMNPVKEGTKSDIARISNVWATQYVPNTSGAMEVALPDKYLKFANLGWSDFYDEPPYQVNVFNAKNSVTLNLIHVDEVGPWNEDDNYWDIHRREFSDLALGVPEAQAAYYDNYNNGKDQTGRTVTNPAGIDLSTAAAKALGFSSYGSGFVDVRYEYLP